MPVYTYQCTNCGVRFERQQHFDEPALTRCPECDENTLRKVYQPVGIVFKGSGFYATDNRSPSGTSRSSNAKAGETETKSNSEGAPEAKTAETKGSENKTAETKSSESKD